MDDYNQFRQAVDSSKNILFLLDNSGEIVFDRLLIEELISMGKSVKAVVKGSPVLNDVTRHDAEQTGLDHVCKVIDNGSDGIGTILEWTSPEFQKVFRESDMIISKGQGNFETVPAGDPNTFYLFQSKCEVVSEVLEVKKGAMLLFLFISSLLLSPSLANLFRLQYFLHSWQSTL